MAVTEDKLQVGIKDEYLDTTTVTQTGGNTTHREAVVLTDAEILAARARISATPNPEDYRLGVADRELFNSLLNTNRQMLCELQEIRFILEAMSA